jgi:hypothetical protein
MYYTLKQIENMGFEVECDTSAFGRRVYWTGPGWYSMTDDEVYEAGIFATYSRINIKDEEE